jgi:phosphatidylglycerophosphate synthase
MPPLSDVLKSRDVEDPVNLWVHRPLAYAFCWLVFRTPMTPNQVTVLAIILGLGAAGCWFEGSPTAMIWGGALLWSSSIMDGADGILARAKHMQSAFGRALDGMADWLVGLSALAACFWHLYVTGAGWVLLIPAVTAMMTTVVQLNAYDFYKEIFVHMTRLDKEREGHSREDVDRLRATEEVKHGPWYTRLSMFFYSDFLVVQNRIATRTNPAALRLLGPVRRTPESAELYRTLNKRPMQLWMMVSLAPHSYLFAIFGMLDRLDLYLWLRITVMNFGMIAAFLLQRQATARTLTEYEVRGLLPSN